MQPEGVRAIVRVAAAALLALSLLGCGGGGKELTRGGKLLVEELKNKGVADDTAELLGRRLDESADDVGRSSETLLGLQPTNAELHAQAKEIASRPERFEMYSERIVGALCGIGTDTPEILGADNRAELINEINKAVLGAVSGLLTGDPNVDVGVKLAAINTAGNIVDEMLEPRPSLDSTEVKNAIRTVRAERLSAMACEGP